MARKLLGPSLALLAALLLAPAAGATGFALECLGGPGRHSLDCSFVASLDETGTGRLLEAHTSLFPGEDGTTGPGVCADALVNPLGAGAGACAQPIAP
jgi:hypothetical protein